MRRIQGDLLIPSTLSTFFLFLSWLCSDSGWLSLQMNNALVVSIDKYELVPPNSEIALKKAVANQPVSVAIEAAGREFQLYQSVCISS